MAASTNIKLNIVEPGTPPSPTPTPTPVDPGAGVDPTAPSTGLFTHGIGGPEATIISAIILLAVAAIVVAVLYNKHKKQGKVTKLVHAVDQCKAIFSSRKRITASLSALALLASVGTLAILLANSNKTNTSAIEGGTELTVDVNSEDLTIEVGDTPVFAYLPVELTVEEATTSGYVLSAYAEDTNLVSTTDESNIIPMVAINEEDLSQYVSLTDNTYGLSLTKPETKDDNIYTALSMDQDNPTILKSIDDYSETEENDTTTIYYGFYITPDTPKGTYEGSNITYTALTNPPVATVTFDGNGLYFNGNEEQTTNTIKYIPNVPTSQTVAYSHTPNVNDEGEQDGMYGYDLNSTTVYRFADTATNVHVKIVQSGNDSACGPDQDDYFTFWSGAHSDYTAKANYTSAVKTFGNADGKYVFGSYNDVETDLSDVDAVTFAYTTNGSYQSYCAQPGYGYYAIITAQDADGNDVPLVGNNPVIGSYAVPSTETTHRFLGWSTDKNALIGTYTSADDFTNYVFNSPDEKVTMYAIWDPIIEITYNGNGADDTTDMNNVTQYTTDFTTAGRTVDLLASNYQRAGYGFIGWSEDKDAYTKLTNGEDVTIYGPNETLTIGREMQQRMSQTGKLELNAIWAGVAKDSQGDDLTFQTDDLLTTELADGTTLATKPNGYVTALKDSRDNEVYAVAKLADGNYWMIENLRLDNSSELSQQNTNYPALPLTNDYNAGTTSNFLSTTSNSWCTNYDSTPCYNQSKLNTNNVAATTTSPSFNQNYTNGTHASDFNTNLYSYGNYYNWYSATAGRGTYDTTSNQVAAGDICPAGWQLPYGGSGDTNNGKGNTNGGFYYLNNLLGNSSNAWRSFPNNFIYSGYWYNSQTSSRGNYGYYWASTANSTSSAYSLYLYNSYVSTSSNNKYSGYSVRCVAPIQTTIIFDGNGNDGGEMAEQGIGENTTAPLSQNGFTKNGYNLASWNTERDGSGITYTNRQEFSAGDGVASIILYAQWKRAPYMQDIANWKSTLNEGDPMQAIDNRDGKTYWVAKLADGNIWMAQNLDLDIEAGRTYTSADTDLANSTIGTTWTPTVSTSTTSSWTSSTTAPFSYNPGNLYWNGNVTTSGGTLSNMTVSDPSATSGGTHYHVGNYYNWTAAVAMNSSSSYTTYDTDVNQSICPAGWRLPTYSGDKSYQNLANAQGFTSGTSGNIQNSPTYFVYGGHWNGSSGYVGKFGYYWSSVVYNNGNSYEIYFNAYGNLSPQISSDRAGSLPLRCVAR
ncbi:InlB B-repeat-containing protein [Candidatus Saccharibacteria bacterium]|nr:InlB B-repeat-containing protein [Candidatus Saccharibacteria bacterium]